MNSCLRGAIYEKSTLLLSLLIDRMSKVTGQNFLPFCENINFVGYHGRKLNVRGSITLHCAAVAALFEVLHRVRKKKRPEYFCHNFDKFRHSFIIFGTNHPDTSAY